jgi:hypothetical protein
MLYFTMSLASLTVAKLTDKFSSIPKVWAWHFVFDNAFAQTFRAFHPKYIRHLIFPL